MNPTFINNRNSDAPENLMLPILRFSKTNLEEINFQPLGVQILKIFSPKFNAYFKSYFEKDVNFKEDFLAY